MAEGIREILQSDSDPVSYVSSWVQREQFQFLFLWHNNVACGKLAACTYAQRSGEFSTKNPLGILAAKGPECDRQCQFSDPESAKPCGTRVRRQRSCQWQNGWHQRQPFDQPERSNLNADWNSFFRQFLNYRDLYLARWDMRSLRKWGIHGNSHQAGKWRLPGSVSLDQFQ